MNEDELRSMMDREAAHVKTTPGMLSRAQARAARRRRMHTAVAGAGAACVVAAATLAVMVASGGGAGHRVSVNPAGPGTTTSVAPPTTLARPSTAPKGQVATKPIAPTTSVMTAPAPSRCHTAELTATAGQSTVATGNAATAFVLTNSSGITCTLYGYPGFQLLDANGRPMIGNVSRNGGYTFPRLTPRVVTLAPGQQASFSIGYADATGYPQGCPMSSTVQITPPDETTQLTVANQPLAVCSAGYYVSPVVPGAQGVGHG